ncbi:MAG: hypothetical protein Kilf2KO_41570 [Rhodospirillales bacterium]
MQERLTLLNSITDATVADRGKIAVSGSHGGAYPALLASRAGLRAVILNDAGIGYEDAGIAGIRDLAGVGMAAAAADCMSCRIGSAADMLAQGQISYVNRIAEDIGVSVGMTVREAAERLAAARPASGRLPDLAEARWDQSLSACPVTLLCVDSASLVRPEDAGRTIITGSHGAIIGGDPARALKARARFAAFNDAGFGKDRVGASRLPLLDEKGVAAVTLSHRSCRIGSARSALSSGIVSAANEAAQKLGGRPGIPLRELIRHLALRA